MKKKIGNLLFTFLCGILIFGVLCQFHILPFRITYFLSGSMSPTYAPGDLAIIYTGGNISIKSGDVILFQVNGEPVIHRVIDINNGEITTQGDANEVVDREKISSVDGKLLFSIPKLGYFFDYIHSFTLSIGELITPG